MRRASAAENGRQGQHGFGMRRRTLGSARIGCRARGKAIKGSESSVGARHRGGAAVAVGSAIEGRGKAPSTGKGSMSASTRRRRDDGVRSGVGDEDRRPAVNGAGSSSRSEIWPEREHSGSGSSIGGVLERRGSAATRSARSAATRSARSAVARRRARTRTPAARSGRRESDRGWEAQPATCWSTGSRRRRAGGRGEAAVAGEARSGERERLGRARERDRGWEAQPRRAGARGEVGDEVGGGAPAGAGDSAVAGEARSRQRRGKNFLFFSSPSPPVLFRYWSF